MKVASCLEPVVSVHGHWLERREQVASTIVEAFVRVAVLIVSVMALVPLVVVKVVLRPHFAWSWFLFNMVKRIWEMRHVHAWKVERMVIFGM